MHRVPERQEFDAAARMSAVLPAADGQRLDGLSGPPRRAGIAAQADRGCLPTRAGHRNLEAAARVKLHRAGLNCFFSFGGYGSDCNDRGELTRIAPRCAALVYGEPVAPDQAITVGDTPHDVTAAHAAGIGTSAWAATISPLSSSVTRRLRDHVARRAAVAVIILPPARRYPDASTVHV